MPKRKRGLRGVFSISVSILTSRHGGDFPISSLFPESCGLRCNLPRVEQRCIAARLGVLAFWRREGKMASGRVSIAAVVLTLLAAGTALAQQAETEQAFDRYVADGEARIARQRSSAESFLKGDSLSTREREVIQRLKRGEVVIEKQGNSPKEIHGGLVHDWTGTVFIPGVNVEQVLSRVKDYDHLERYYTPHVMRSQLIS